MAIKVSLSPSQEKDLRKLLDADHSKLTQLLEKLHKIEAPFISNLEFKKYIAETFNDDIASILAKNLVYIGTMARRRAVSFDDFLKATTDALRAKNWKSEELERWSVVSDFIFKAAKLDHVSSLIKAFDLSYDYTNLLSSTRILTDIRPIFDIAHSRVVAAVVCTTLRIDYDSDDGRHTLSIALDEKEIEGLRDACTEAMKKIRASQALLKDKCVLPSLVRGQENYDD